MTVFGDTYYFLALLNSNDPANYTARRWAERPDLVIITTRWVLAEVADALCQPPFRQRAVRFIDRLAVDSGIEVLTPSDDLYTRGLDLYRDRPDKHWSLTDCISFAVMEREGLREALTGDHHFEQAGFVALFAGE